MEPQIPTPNTTPESGGFINMPRGPEMPQVPRYESAPQQFEQGERQESRERITGKGAGDGTPRQAAIPQVPVAPQAPVGVGMPGSVQDDAPLVAADEDLIEMEWVNKAKKIVNDTKADPYLQEQQVSRLQASYLQKRYGKEVKVSKDE